MGVANLFSKIKPKATILSILALIIVALVLHILPPLGLVLWLFATIPGIVLWQKSKESFGLAAVITVILTTLLGNVFVLSVMVLILVLSFIIGQLLTERTSKERILYITTTFVSIITLVAFMLLQAFNKIPSAASLTKPLKDQMHTVITSSGVEGHYKQMLEESFRQMAVQLPSYVIVTAFVLILINLLITFPILRKFKVATPIFKPLFAWQMRKSLLFMYVIVLICVMFAVQPGTFQSIVLNFEIVLSLCMYIQGLSVIHFFGKAKSMPPILTVLLMVIGTILTPLTHIVVLIGFIDLAFNLKGIIKK
ncbi:YybS family protein [Staphylococcus arlettae]|uniref:YybS family protein n=1 Tax=Staphylococcus arlettae TaxID=29378 RepID=UPI003BA03AFF